LIVTNLITTMDFSTNNKGKEAALCH